MTIDDIYECFGSDTGLFSYFDPESKAKNNMEACIEIYNKLIEFSKDRECVFKKCEIGYIFYSEGLLISFCVKPKYRIKRNLIEFGEFIESEVGRHYRCYLYNKNERAIKFLERLGLTKVDSNDLITLLIK